MTAGTYDLSATTNQNAIGLDALDYLIFRTNAKTQADANSAVWSYILAVVSKMDTEVSSIYTQFQAYRSTFINGTGTSSTSPFSLLVNAFSREFELTKNTKIGIPIGNLTLGIVQKGYIENRRSGIANELLVVNLETLQSIFKGTNTVNGFEDYLNEIEKSEVASTINSRFNYLISTGASWTETIKSKIDSSLPELTAYYDYMQGTVVYLKTDMPSSFGVLITYQDNDGD
ncbi:MAG: imelysin family protein [Fluviicola sp.]